jgi:hypothetical protein
VTYPTAPATENHRVIWLFLARFKKPNLLNLSQDNATIADDAATANGSALFHVKRCISLKRRSTAQRREPGTGTGKDSVNDENQKLNIPTVIHRVFHCRIHRCIHSHTTPGTAQAGVTNRLTKEECRTREGGRQQVRDYAWE